VFHVILASHYDNNVSCKKFPTQFLVLENIYAKYPSGCVILHNDGTENKYIVHFNKTWWCK